MNASDAIIEQAPYDVRTAQPICPFCGEPALELAWQTNPAFGVTTLFHAVPNCNRVLGVQIRPEDAQHIVLQPGAGRRH